MYPFFSIVVPTLNRPHSLSKLLESMCALEYPKDHFEVIIVWSKDDANPETVVRPFREQLRITLLTASCHGPGPARQAGAACATGDYIAFTDDDCELDVNWLRFYEMAFESDYADAVGGRVINKLARNPFSSTSQCLIDFVYDHYNSDRDHAAFFTTNNAAVSAELFHAMGGFDREWHISGAEDRDFWIRWRQAGYRMVYDPRILIYHAHGMDWRSFLGTHYRYGQGAFHFHKRHGQEALKSARFFYRLPAYFLSHVPFPQSLRYLVLVFVSQIASTAGFIDEWARSRSQG